MLHEECFHPTSCQRVVAVTNDMLVKDLLPGREQKKHLFVERRFCICFFRVSVFAECSEQCLQI